MSGDFDGRARAASHGNGPGHLPSIKQRERAAADQRLDPRAWVREIGLIVLVALIISSLLRAFVVQVFWIPSPSMRNTLIEDDRIAVSRIAALRHDVQRGDVVVFRDDLGWLPAASADSNWLEDIGEFVGVLPDDGEQTLVKRVIGVAGDRVSCEGSGQPVMVNGVPIEESAYVADGQTPSTAAFDVTVPDGHLWVMGDNRANSADSRYHMGEGESPFIGVDSVVGTVSAVIWPTDRWTTDISHREAFAGVEDAR